MLFVDITDKKFLAGAVSHFFIEKYKDLFWDSASIKVTI